jgi:hypothetical protein
MLDARRGNERRLDPLADNEAALHLIIGPQANYTAGIWSQCFATDFLAALRDCSAVNGPRLTGYSVGRQRDHTAVPGSACTPRTMWVPAQNRVDARGELAKCDTAGREVPPCRRAVRIHAFTPDGERTARTRTAIGTAIRLG